MHTQNMRLWDQVQATDPSATKSAKFEGQQITSISGQHMIMKATQMFGPVGIGWGWTVIEERFDWGFHAHLDTHSTNTWTVIPR
ncbi:hypothetical protein [Pseudomonas aeruginosa]|uniref:hypothetical protein n=1 Tax=Pseudomonas aeruginosa TaxID=287 RepID=UPI003B587908